MMSEVSQLVTRIMGSAISTSPENVSPEMRSKFIEDLVLKCKDVLTQNPNNRCCRVAIDYLVSDTAKSLSNVGKKFSPCIIIYHHPSTS